MKNKRQIPTSNCIKTASGCVLWTGPEIPCLDICPGDELNDLVYAIAQKVCTSLGDTNLSTLSLQCLVDKLNVVLPTERTILTLFQLAFDNNCKLADLIKNLEATIVNPNAPLDLNFKCLIIEGPGGSSIPVTQMLLNQVLITEFCLLKTRVSGLELKDIDLQAQINALTAIPTYVEPILTTCWAGTRTLSQQVIQGYASLCTYRDAVGTTTEISRAISSQPTGLNTVPYTINPNWQPIPNSLADADVNQWIVINSLLTRITTLEACACKVTCKDITVGFLTTFNSDRTVTLKFTSGAGSSIPVDFVNCGSNLTIKDDRGVVFGPINIPIAQNYQSVDIDISMFTPGEYLTFSLDAQLCSEAFNCSKCVTKVVRNTAGCCLITNNGASPVTIIYQICGLPA